MNRSRETMQFIQALSAPTRASFSLYLEYKELLAFIPVIPTASVHPSSPFFHPLLPIVACAYINPTQQSKFETYRSSSSFPFEHRPPFFSNAARRSFSSTTNHPLWKSIDRECPTKSRSIERFFKGRGPRRYLLYEIFMNDR